MRIWNAAVNHIRKSGTYSAKMLKDKPVKAVISETQRILDDGMQSGLSDNEPPQQMTDSLRSDVFVFSACKTHIQLKELSSMLLNDQGKVTPMSEFKQKATELHQQYNGNYLEAEYVFATSSAQMAAQWADVAQSENRYDLQYRTAGDSQVRETHRRLSNITLPADDPFWDAYYPPNGWRCRCTAIQVRKGKYPQSDSNEAITRGEIATTEIDAQGNNRAEMFRFNPGKQQVIFPPSHPYYKVKETVTKNVKQ